MDKPKLLLIDDELEKQKSLIRLLEKKFEVSTATTVMEGKRKLAQSEHHVAIIDMKLPQNLDEPLEDEAGLEICKYVRDKFIKTRGIILTGYGTVLNFRKALEFGVYDYLTKGDFHPNDVIYIAEKALNAKHSMLIYYDDKTLGLFELLCQNRKTKFQIIERSLKLYDWAEQCNSKGYREIIAKKGNSYIKYIE